MIQFNLLPDVKLAFIKTRRLKRLVSAIASIVAGVTLVIFILLLVFVEFVQKSRINSLSSKITVATKQVSNTSNLNKILTVQNQLKSLPALDASKPVVSRLFGYLSQITPSQASIASVSTSITSGTIALTGSANSITTVNTLVDTLKFTTYSNATDKSTGSAFSNVVLAGFSVGSGSGAQSTSYSISANFSAVLFNSADNITLTVPNEITTRSVLDLPTNPLFQSQPTQANK